jgi:hypothetical protein
MLTRPRLKPLSDFLAQELEMDEGAREHVI